jgi:mannose-6-phosphate isomerase-like protein (cupin superfamily)
MVDHHIISSNQQPAPSTRKIRRLVTGLNARGQSTIVMEDVAKHATAGHGGATYVATQIWRTETAPADNTGPAIDPYDTDEPVSIGPSAAGTVFRTLEVPPDKDWRFDAAGNEIRPLNYHTTRSIDYAVVLSGSVWAVLDDTEVEMHAGDVLVQRGTAHAWSNRSDLPCLMAFVLIGGTLPGEG